MDVFSLNLLLWVEKLVSKDLNGKKCHECLVAKPNEGLIGKWYEARKLCFYYMWQSDCWNNMTILAEYAFLKFEVYSDLCIFICLQEWA